ncbi:MAG: Asp-tRNA(Asn)/Glu-tRNA(Gln) amidotransferase subunit GatA, partial [Proteobacteria bacterium]|nr:Asp-tRNA(Asn)/Glu-tRNA(Gln) amidotransferase subunit GatA [Pseudomonadota bacterium]
MSLIIELAKKLKDKETTSVELTKEYLARIEKVDGKINAFLAVTADEALEAASAADKLIAEGKGGPLTGVPISVKDIFCTKGVPTTCASKILEGFRPPYDAHVVEKLKAAGAVILGKNNMDEFAMGSSTENSAYKKTVNPWGENRVPGGSSGGSAASLASGECVASVGTDTGGSIRQPASLCGTVGLKPTYGRVSRYGMIAFASSLDQAGPLTTTVEDAAIMLNIISGHDPRDSTSIDAPVPDFTADLNGGVKGLKIGIPKEYFIEGIDPEVEKAIKDSLKVLDGLGAELVDIS